MKREKYVNGIFNHCGQGASFMLAAFILTLFALVFISTGLVWAGGNASQVDFAVLTQPSGGNVEAGNTTAKEVFAFEVTVTITGGTGKAGTMTVYLQNLGNCHNTTTDITNMQLYIDNGTQGTYEPGTDTYVSDFTFGTEWYNSTGWNTGPGTGGGEVTNFLVILDVPSGAHASETFQFQIDSTVSPSVSPADLGTVATITGNTFTITGPTPDTVSVDTTNQVGATTVAKNAGEIGVFAFNLSTDTNTAEVTEMNFKFGTGNAAVYNTDVQNFKLYTDSGTVGQFGAGDVYVADLTQSGSYFTNAVLSQIIGTGGTDYIVTGAVMPGAGDNVDIVLAMEAGNHGTDPGVVVTSPDVIDPAFTAAINGNAQTIDKDTVSVDTTNQVGATTVGKGDGEIGVFAFNLSTATGSATVTEVNFKFGTGNAAVYNTDVQNFKLYTDGGTVGQFGAGDVWVADLTQSGSYFTNAVLSQTINTTGPNYIVTGAVMPGAGDNIDIVLAMEAGNHGTDPGVVVTSPDVIDPAFTAAINGNAQTIDKDTVSVDTTNQVGATTVGKGDGEIGVFAFNLSTATGSATVTEVNFKFGTGNAAVYNTDVQNFKLYTDGGTVGQFGAGDVWVADLTQSGSYFTNAGLSQAINTTGTDYIVTGAVMPGAGDNIDIVLAMEAGNHGTDPGVVVTSPDIIDTGFTSAIDGNAQTIDKDTVSVDTTNQVAAGDVNVNNEVGVFAFNLSTNTGSAEVTEMNFKFGTGNQAVYGAGNDVQNFKLYTDGGTLGQFGVGDVYVADLTQSGSYFTNASLSQTINTGGTDYIVTVYVLSTATEGNDIVLAMEAGNHGTDPGVVVTSPDVIDPAFTAAIDGNARNIVSAPPTFDMLKVSDGTGQVGATSIFRGDRNVPILQFSLIASDGGQDQSVTITSVYLNFYGMGGGVIDNFISSNMVKLYQDATPYGTLDNNDVFKGIFSCDSTTCTLGNLSETVNTVSSNYYMVTGNTTSTPIYSSFTVGFNDSGGFGITAPDTLAANNPTGVTSGNITQDFDRKLVQGWNLVTASKADTTVNYSSVFSDDTAPYVPFMIEWSNTNVDSSWDCGTCAWSSTVQNDTMSYGKGYFFFAEENGQILSTNGGSYATLQHSVSLIKGANIVGNPFNYILPMDATWPATGVYIDNGSTQESLKQAATNGWIEADLFWYNGNTYEAVNVDSAVDPYNYMVPWRGYWIRLTETTGSYSIIFKP